MRHPSAPGLKSWPSHPQANAGGCAHHWVIESPGGPISTGVCKFCSAIREFRNSFETGGWDRETFSERMTDTTGHPR